MNIFIVWLKRWTMEILLCLALLLFVILKIPYLNLPYFWDEAWSYAMAVHDMVQSGPTLLPGSASEWYTRGHPLLFYFLASVWMKIFGAGLVSAHAFALLISLLAILTIYLIGRAWMGKTEGLFLAFALMSQYIFFTQSVMLLPEVFLMLLSLLVFYSYMNDRRWLFVISSCALVLTKETGLVLILVIWFDRYVLCLLIREKIKKYLNLGELATLLSPLVVFSSFLLIQKLRLGYFFFPEHTDLIVLDVGNIMHRLSGLAEQLFILNGMVYWLPFIIAAIVYIIWKRGIEKGTIRLIVFSLLFILVYLLFSAANFYTTRYLLSALPFVLLVHTLLLYAAFRRFRFVVLPTYLLLLIVHLVTTINLKKETDNSPAYRDAILNHKAVVNFLEEEKVQDKKISTGFLMEWNLRYPQLGYLTHMGESFTHLGEWERPDILITYSIDPESSWRLLEQHPEYILLKRFERGISWAEIYTLP